VTGYRIQRGLAPSALPFVLDVPSLAAIDGADSKKDIIFERRLESLFFEKDRHLSKQFNGDDDDDYVDDGGMHHTIWQRNDEDEELNKMPAYEELFFGDENNDTQGINYFSGYKPNNNNYDSLDKQLQNEAKLSETSIISSKALQNDQNQPQQGEEEETKQGISASYIENSTTYLSILAFIRLLLLTFPLASAAYFGTRVPCVIFHYAFEGTSAMAVLSHMLAVLVVDQSVNVVGGDTDILHGDDDVYNHASRSNGVDGDDDKGGDSLEYHNAWALLSLSLVSIMLHFLIVLHVRSTGPTTPYGLYEEHRRKRKRLAYAMAARSNGGIGLGGSKGNGEMNGVLRVNGENVSHHDDDIDEEHGTDETLSPLLLPEGKGISDINNLNKRKLSTASKQLWKERFMCLPDQYEAFLTEAQIRFDAARRMWGDRLEDVTRTLQKSGGGNNSEEGNGGGGNEYTSISMDGDDEQPTGSQENGNSPNNSNYPIHDAIQSAASNATNQLQSKLVLPMRPDPFRVLLQLFAYEDVWSNRRLDMAFATELMTSTNSNNSLVGEGDSFGRSPTKNSRNKNITGGGSAALSFYAPQLLSFLLHGAYFDISSKLEEWILKKCGEDLHFAHRCFWFLRSWCLGAGGIGKPGHTRSRSGGSGAGSGLGHSRNLSGGSFGPSPSGFMSYSGEFGTLDPGTQYSSVASQYGLAMNQLKGLEQNLYLAYNQRLQSQLHNQQSPLLMEKESVLSALDAPSPITGGNVVWDTYSLVAPGAAEGVTRESTTSKFSPDEQVLIEQLLLRVVKRGSRPAMVAQYGSIDGSVPVDFETSNSDCVSYSPSALATAVEEGLVPIDPRTGFHSAAHLDSITSQQKYGFLPLNSSGEPYQQQHMSYVTHFFAGPMFLDALLSVADDLMNVTKANRTTELRQRLRSLEVELLPSNVIYLPIQNMQHRVWRIVPEESLALSTNERVPCIITLEVIDYGNVSSNTANRKSNNMSEDSAITSAWVNNPRPPQRHNTIMDKFATYTQVGLRRLEDTIDHLSHHGDKRGGLERRLSDFLNSRNDMRSRTASSDSALPDDNERNSSTGDEETPSADSNSKTRTSISSPKMVDLDAGVILELCPPLPLGSPRSSTSENDEQEAEKEETRIIANVASPPKSRDNSTLYSANDQTFNHLEAPQTPTAPITESDDLHESPMGQWSTPTSLKKRSLKLRKRHMQAIEDIEEEEDEEYINFSPQAKQRKRVMFPPPTESMTRSESVGDHPRMVGPVAPEDTDITILKSAPTVVFKEDWKAKTDRLRKKSVHGSHPGWRLLPILIKSNDDLRQEQLASQLIQRMALILAKANVPVWLFPYEIVALTGRGGIIECVPDTISIDSLKRNDPDFTDLKSFFAQHFGPPGSDSLCDAKANFVESLAAYSIVCFLLQIKDRHNGNILLDNKGHIVHIDFGFYFLSSPGKNSGFESAPFKLSRDFVNLMDGPDSRSFAKFRELCYKTFIELRKNCYQITLLVEMLMEGNEDLACFRGKPEEAVRGLRERFRLDLNDHGCIKYVDSLIDESLENWRTRWYDRYQRFCVGVL